MAKKIYVGNLPFTATEDDIRQLFSQYGEVSTVSIVSDRETGQSKGFGFVEMADGDAQKAMSAQNGQELDGRGWQQERFPRLDPRAMAMHAVSVSGLKNNPAEALRQSKQGVVVVLAPDEPSLLALVSLAAPVILSGNTAIVVASDKFPLPAVTFSEILATSDLPGGVVNILTGKRAELVPYIAGHLDVNAIVDATGDAELGAKLQAGTAINLKRYAKRALAPADWFTAKAEDAYWILDTVEMKTAWHPIGI
jgi:hypothetical protein